MLHVPCCILQADQSDIYYYLHKKLDDNYDVISALERQLMVETADREKAETEYGGHIDDLEHRMDEELAPLNDKLITLEEQVRTRTGVQVVHPLPLFCHTFTSVFYLWLGARQRNGSEVCAAKCHMST